ncbi:MAG: DUF2442 domain-containing protein [Spirochaetota bacterium]
MLVKIQQVYPVEDYKVYLYFDDGKIKLYDLKPLLTKGVFQKLQDKTFFKERCTVLNNTLAWDLSGNYDPTNCLDLDPIELYKTAIDVEEDPLEKLFS